MYSPHFDIFIDFIQEIKRSFEEGTTSTYAKTIALSTDSESVSSLFLLYISYF